jgi:hypothetical protein
MRYTNRGLTANTPADPFRINVRIVTPTAIAIIQVFHGVISKTNAVLQVDMVIVLVASGHGHVSGCARETDTIHR